MAMPEKSSSDQEENYGERHAKEKKFTWSLKQLKQFTSKTWLRALAAFLLLYWVCWIAYTSTLFNRLVSTYIAAPFITVPLGRRIAWQDTVHFKSYHEAYKEVSRLTREWQSNIKRHPQRNQV